MVKILTQVLTLCGYSIYTLTRSFLFFLKNLRRYKVVVNISDQNLTCDKKKFQNLTCCKNSDPKKDELFKVDWKSDKFCNSWFKVWRVVKTCFKIWLFSKLFISKTAFYPFFLHIMVFEKADNCRIWGFAW